MKRLVRARCARAAVAASVVLTVCGAATLAAGASAAVLRPVGAPSQAVTPGSRYLALGDSVTFGYEEPTVVPAPNYNDAASFLGYPEMLGAELHLNVANAACAGETSSSFINTSAVSNGCENTLGDMSKSYRKLYPLHVSYKGSQLAFALSYLKSHKNVRLVSLMIGADDFLVCEETTKDACASSAEQSAVAATLTKNIQTILSSIRNKAHYKGQLAIVNYYSLDYASATDDAQSTGLNNVQDSAAKPFHVIIADGYGEFEAASVHSGDDTCTAGLLTQLGTPGKCGIHPSYAGQALLTQSLEKVIHIS